MLQRGLTPEQLTEIDESFALFDKDNSQSIDIKELKGLFYSLGYEKGPKEVQSIMAEFGVDGKMEKAQFREFMIGLIGDTESKEEIVAGWKLIGKGADRVDWERVEGVMGAHELAYLKAWKSGATDLDYAAWTDEVFAR